MGRVFRAICCCALLLTTASLFAQEMPLCGVTCEPDPESLTYLGTVEERPKPYNVRGRSSVFSVAAATSARSTALADVLAGSESYNYAIPILSLPGRNGLDVNLTLHYNSRIWTINKASGTVTLNADRDFPSYGFRLGYGYLEFNDDDESYIVTGPDGSKHQLLFVSGNIYDAKDSSYLRYLASQGQGILLSRNGSKVYYELLPGQTTLFRPYRVQDTNGNYIEIDYGSDSWATGQEISQITDTLGRVITFSYHATDHTLTGISHSAPEGTRTYAFTWNTSYQLNYNFSLSVTDSPESGSTQKVLTGVTYPNGTKYTFEYGEWGIVKKIHRLSANSTLRSYVEYNYPGTSSALADHPAFTLQKVSEDGGTPVEWAYSTTKSNGVVTATTVTAPDGTQTKTNLTSGGLVSSITITPTGQQNPLRTIAYTWDGSPQENPRVASVATTLNDSNQNSKVEYVYTTSGNVHEVKEYDYGFNLTRRVQTDYLTTQAYLDERILDRPTQIRVYAGSSSSPKSRTDFAYDGTTPSTPSGTVPNHDAQNFSSSFNTRGNVTSVTVYADAAAPSGAITRNFTYDTLGNLLTADLSCCNQRTWEYDETTKWAYPTEVTSGSSPDQLTQEYEYDLHTGLLTSATDPNGKTTTYAYDLVNRVTAVTRPDSVQLAVAYDDNSAAPVVTRTTPIESGKSVVEEITMNGVGRTTKRRLKNAGGTTVGMVDTEHDSLGRVLKVSNPYTGGTPLFTTWEYDGLGRVKKVIPPDGSSGSNHTAYSYSGNRVTVTDPTGKQRRSYYDALGRLTRVDEPGNAPGVGTIYVLGFLQSYEQCNPPEEFPWCWDVYDSGGVSVTVNGYTVWAYYGQSSTSATVAADIRTGLNMPGSPVSAGGTGETISLTANSSGADTNWVITTDAWSDDPTNFGSGSFSASGDTMTGGSDISSGTLTLDRPYPTFYLYDALDNLTKVTQGLQERLYTYDSLGRLIESKTPESNNAATLFTYTGAGRVHTRTDPRGVVTTYSYDGLLRLTQVAYDVGQTGVPSTPTVTYTYGTSASNNNIGRLVSIAEGSGFSESFTYDLLGRVTQASKVIDSVTYDVGYSYNWASEVTSVTYPSSRVVTQSYDAVGRLEQIASSGTNYLTVESGGYNAASQVTALTYGNGVEGTFTYNSRHQLASLKYVNGTTDLLHLSYGYGTANNGQIQGITNHLNTDHSTSYAYDGLGRLQEAQTASLTAADTWKLAWTYDRYGNRLTQTLTGGTISVTQPQLTVSPYTNRITTSGYQYDGSGAGPGNLTNDAINTYSYDAENRMVSVNSTSAAYTYVGALRVKKVASSTTTRYVFSGSKVIAEYENGSLSKEYVYGGGQLVATLNSSGTPTYHHRDHLSARVETNTSGSAVRTYGQLPFGETWYESGTASKWKFTTYERDSESGLDYAIFRYNSPRLGRFTSPDLLAGSITSPQSLNRYSYTGNDPVNLIDPLGLFPCGPGERHVLGQGCKPYQPGNPNDPDGPTEPPQSGGSRLAWGSDDGMYEAEEPHPELGPREGGGGGDVQRQWIDLFKCVVNAQQLMAAIQKNFANWASGPFGPTFARFGGTIAAGETVTITTGARVPVSPFFVTANIPVQSNKVNVVSAGSHGFTFETVKGQHFFYPGTINFSVADLKGGTVGMWITASGDFSSIGSWAQFTAGGFAAESATWRRVFNAIRKFCKGQ